MAGKPQYIQLMAPIHADASLAEIVERVLFDEGIADFQAGSGVDGIRVAACEEKRECSTDTIWWGGWIKCSVAHAAARKLGIPASKMGALLFALNVKIRQCELGCFK